MENKVLKLEGGRSTKDVYAEIKRETLRDGQYNLKRVSM